MLGNKWFSSAGMLNLLVAVIKYMVSWVLLWFGVCGIANIVLLENLCYAVSIYNIGGWMDYDCVHCVMLAMHIFTSLDMI